MIHIRPTLERIRNLVRLTFGIVFVLSSFCTSSVFASPSALTYQGRIIKTDGTPLEFNSVSFLFQLTDPSGSCIIYQEQITGYSMVNSGGVFDVPIGTGSVQYPLGGPVGVLSSFNNAGTFTCGTCNLVSGNYVCSDSSSNYIAAASDNRKLRVSFYDGSGWKTISPDSVIRSVPFAGYALSAQKLGTNTSADFILKNDVNNSGSGSANCDSGNFLTWNATTNKFGCSGVSGASGGTVTNVTSGNSYLNVANGNAAPVLTLNVGTISNTVAAGDDSRFSNARTPTGSAGGDLTGAYPNPSVAKIGGTSLVISSLTSGQALKYNGTGWINAALSTADLSDASSLIKASQMPANCTANQTLTFSSPSGAWICSNISITGSAFGSQTQATFLAAPAGAAGNPSFRTLTSTDLPSGVVAPGSYTGVTVDTYGRVVSGTNPSTAAGYGITDAFINGGNSFGAAPTLGSNDAQDFGIKTNGTTRVTVNSNGNVGIGTTTPSYLVDVNGTSTGPGTITASGTSITGSGTTFTKSLSVGDTIRNTSGEKRTVTAIAGDTSLTIHAAYNTPPSNSTYTIVRKLSFGEGNISMGTSTATPIYSGASLFPNAVPKLEIQNNETNWDSYSELLVLRASSSPLNTGATRQMGVMFKLSNESNLNESQKSGGIMLESSSGYANNPSLSLAVADSRRLTITSAGNVGIGTTTPSGLLEVASDQNAGTKIRVSNVAVGTGAFAQSATKSDVMNLNQYAMSSGYTTSNQYVAGSALLEASGSTSSGFGLSTVNGPIRFYTSSGQERMRIDSTGNIGIGTTSPAATLDVNGVIKSSNAVYGTSLNLSGSGQALNWPGNTERIQANSSSHYMQLITNNTEAIRIDSSGKVGIGTSTPSSALHVANGEVTLDNGHTLIFGSSAYSFITGGDGAGSYLSLGTSGASVLNINVAGQVGIGTQAQQYPLHVIGDINSSTRLRINGTQVCTSAGCTASSDLRLKENVRPLANSFEKITQLQGVEYDWIDKEKYGQQHQVGLIAQDLEKVYPEVVITDPESGLKSVAYDHLVGPMIEAFKELNRRLLDVASTSQKQAREIASVRAEAEQLKIESLRKDKKILNLEKENLAIKAYLCGKDPTAAICK